MTATSIILSDVTPWNGKTRKPVYAHVFMSDSITTPHQSSSSAAGTPRAAASAANARESVSRASNVL